MSFIAAIPLGADSFEVTLGPAAVVWLLTLVAILICGAITMAKGRWGWFAVGLVTGGLLWLVGALLDPVAGSFWARRRPRATRAGYVRRCATALGGTAALFAVVVAFGQPVTESSGETSEGFTTHEIELTVGDVGQMELRRRLRVRHIEGTVSVDRVDCSEEVGPGVACLAYVRATGDARRLSEPGAHTSYENGQGKVQLSARQVADRRPRARAGETEVIESRDILVQGTPRGSELDPPS